MEKQPVGQLPDLTQSNNDDEIMVITNSEYNQLKKEKISDFITDLTSTNENNAIVKGTDGKLFTKDFGNASNITEGTLPTSVLPEIPLDKLPDIPKDKLPDIEITDLPASGVSADTYAYPSSVTVNAQGQVTGIVEGAPGANNANQDLSNISSTAYDNINQSKALETGYISSNSIIYSDVLSYRNSGSKTLTEVINPANYTVTGSPNISDEGYLDTSSGYDSSNCITTISGIDLREGNIKGLNISFEFRLNEIKPGFVLNVLAQNESNSVLRFGVNTSGTMNCQMWKNGSLQGQATTTTVLTVNTWYKVILSGSNNSFKIALYEDSEVSVDPEQIENPSFPLSPDEEITLSANYSLAGNISAITFPPSNIANYIFSLNDLKIEVGGELIYSPYLAINYIQSKTGSKIADAYYRYIIRQIYEENGYAPYYTIDIVNQTFTLPMGEVYGMIQKNTSRFEQTPHVVKTYINTEHSDTYSVDITSWYRIWSDGWCEQGQEAGSASDFTKDRTINLLKAYKDTNYFISGVGFVINGIGNQFISEKTPSSFTTSSNTRSAGTNHWMAAGYIDLDSEV